MAEIGAGGGKLTETRFGKSRGGSLWVLRVENLAKVDMHNKHTTVLAVPGAQLPPSIAAVSP